MISDKKEIRYIIHLLSKYKGKIITNTLLSLIAMGFYMLLPLIEQQIIDEGLLSQQFDYLLRLIIITAVLYIAAFMIEYVQMNIQATMAAHLRNTQKMDTLKHALKLKISFLQKHSLLALMTDANTDINNISRICSNDVFGILVEFVTVLGYLIGLLLLSWKLTLIILCLLPIKLFISSIVGNMSSKKMEELLNIQKRISRWQSDNYPGILEIKNWNLYNHIETEFYELSTKREKLDRQMYIYNALDTFMKKSIEKAGFVIVYLFGAMQIWNNRLSIGTFIAFIQFSEYLLSPVDVLSSLKIVIGNVIPSVKSYKQFMNQEEEKSEQKLELVNAPDRIQFDDLSFSYDKKKILDHFSLTLYKGEKVAIVGLNGSGKSTLINLLMRYYIPDQGKITFDNIDIQQFSLDTYREQFSVMEQNVFLFNTSIQNNITMFDYNKSYSDYSDILNYVEKLPEKEETKVGFNGANLSGGEKQRVALVRSLTKDAGILILDEATSNCDVAIENIYTKELRLIKRDYVICITHDYKMLKNFDRIILLQNGMIIKDGTFNEVKYQLDGIEDSQNMMGKRKRLIKRGDESSVNCV